MILADAAKAATTDELHAARSLLHRIRPRRADGRVVEPPYPTLLAAACLELTAELSRRQATLAPCPPCVATVRGSIVQPAAAG